MSPRILGLCLLGFALAPPVAARPGAAPPAARASAEVAAQDARRLLDAVDLARALAALQVTAAQANRVLPELDRAQRQLRAAAEQDDAAMARLASALEAARGRALAGELLPAAEQQYDAAVSEAATRRQRLRLDLTTKLESLLRKTLSQSQVERLQEVADETWDAVHEDALWRVGRGNNAEGGSVRRNRTAARLLDRIRGMSEEQWAKSRGDLAEEAGQVPGAQGVPPAGPEEAARQRRMARRLALYDRVRQMSDEEYRGARSGLATGLGRQRQQTRASQSGSPAGRLRWFVERYLLNPEAPVVFRARARPGRPAAVDLASRLVMALRQSPGAPEAEPVDGRTGAARAAAALRVLRAVNQLQLSPDQGARLSPILAEWQRNQEAAEKTSAAELATARDALRRSLPTVGDSEEETPAETAGRRALLQRESRLAGVRDTAAAAVVQLLKEQLAAPQMEKALTMAREAAARDWLSDPRHGTQEAATLVEDLDGMRRESATDYARTRERLARRLADAQPARGGGQPGATPRNGTGGRGAGGRNGMGRRAAGAPAAAGAPGGRPPREITDPAVRARVQRLQTLFDQIRAMAPEQWAKQRGGIALQLAREHGLARVAQSSANQLLRTFVAEFMLLPGSADVLAARFPGSTTTVAGEDAGTPRE
jgi:hypothetical protein